MIRIGTRLREVRQKKGLTLADVSQNTKIRTEFLEAIENGEYNKLPSASYAQGFVRNYASFLGVPEKEALALFRREFDEERIYRVLPQGLPERQFSVKRFKSSTLLLVLALFSSLLIFILFQYRDAFINPGVTINTPSENQIIKTSDVTISGKTDPANQVFVENFPVSPDTEGNFSKIITLFEGKTQITIRVVNRFNRETKIIRTVEIRPS
jgi:cytoskeletal protein RodZ